MNQIRKTVARKTSGEIPLASLKNLPGKRDTLEASFIDLDDSSKDLLAFSQQMNEVADEVSSPRKPTATRQGRFKQENSKRTFSKSPNNAGGKKALFERLDIFVPPNQAPESPSASKLHNNTVRRVKSLDSRTVDLRGEKPSKRATSKEYRTDRGVRRHKSAPPESALMALRRPKIAVYPGQLMPLVGSEESIAAWQAGTVREVACEVCKKELFCVATCCIVLCPTCRSFSALEPVQTESHEFRESQLGHVGIGLTTEALVASLSHKF